ncbi:CocE/NonD family hydrolase [Paenibacillus sp. NEAU-GSW1]|uniref:CocE/NonD family hydrolase n=1 Tax=Paenibacillus sp. NEAU-GSW1 TaxID=2682486 RepID=UPI0012E15001|nr:CocE/NonD family hydrolase [Paenibacillus sp. NEAU-GSW1]MUT67620.1 CocE/NonD family hydrolase [Paenibacillus sp. NEAU-GSW1]
MPEVKTAQAAAVEIQLDRDVPVVMRDGVKLLADIYRPKEGGPYPVLVMRTPYNKADAQTMNYAHPSWYARHGYIVVVQDTRGRWSSEGEFAPYANESEDGYDTVEWAAALPGAEPKVGMYGFSYVGAAQWQAAVSRPPHLACIVPGMIGSDSYQGKAYRNGAFSLALSQSWVFFAAQDTALRRKRTDWAAELGAQYAAIHSQYRKLPLSDLPEAAKETAPYYLEWLRHPTRDSYWSLHALREQYERIEVPALHIGGWYDIFIDGTIDNFNGIRERGGTAKARENQFLLIEPWFHMPWSRYVGELDFGEEAANRIDSLQIEWFDYWLKDKRSNRFAHQPAVQYFEMGSNRWRQSDSWPIAGAEAVPYYLRSEQRANSINGDGRLSIEQPPEHEYPDVFVYHPSIAVPALGGRSGAVPDLTPMGPKNQLPIEIRNDVLVYTSDTLDRKLAIAGEITMELYASTSAEDTDFVAKLIDVYPDGKAYNIAEGIIRASYRNGLDRREAVTPGEIIRYSFSLGPTAHAFKPGHTIRIDITSSLFPTFDRNPNALVEPGEATEADFETATQTIYHDSSYPSKVWLPVIR